MQKFWIKSSRMRTVREQKREYDEELPEAEKGMPDRREEENGKDMGKNGTEYGADHESGKYRACGEAWEDGTYPDEIESSMMLAAVVVMLPLVLLGGIIGLLIF